MFHSGVTSVRLLVPMNFSKIKFLLAAPAVMAAAFVVPAAQAQSADALTQYASEGRPVVSPMSQVTSVSQLRDVKPTDWSFQALQSLVERYGCIAGYPDGSFRGNRAMTRFEFAAGLNACLDRVNELIASSTADAVSKEDLAALSRMTEEFQGELETLKGRADGLEFRVNDLEAKQFSTTTKLTGEVIMDVGGLAGGAIGFDRNSTTGAGIANSKNDSADEVTLSSRVRLVLNTSFTGQDLLRTRLQAANISGYDARFENSVNPGTGATNTTSLPMAGVEYQAATTGGNTVVLNELWYRFPIGAAKVWVGTHGLDADKIVSNTASFTQSYAFNDFLEHSPIYKGPRGAGAAFNYPVTDKVNIAGAYLGTTAGFSSAGSGTTSNDTDKGLFGSSNSLFTQLTFTPSPKVVLAAAYSHNYNPDGSNDAAVALGTNNARNPFGNKAAVSDNLSLQAGYRFSPKFNVSGWTGWSWMNSSDDILNASNVAANSATATKGAEATVFNWAVNFGFPDLFKEGNYAGIGFGAAPYVTDSNIRLATNGLKREDASVPYVINAFYNYKLSDNISIQPQAFYIINPDGDKANDNIWAGSLRTTFKF
jgi:hypothetical protein